MIRFVIVLSIMTMVACRSQSSVPGGFIKPDVMRGIVFDLLRADEFVSVYFAKDSTLDRKKETIKMYEQVFAIHKTSKADFFKSYRYYQEHPDKFKIMIDSLTTWAVQHKPSDSIQPAKIAQ